MKTLILSLVITFSMGNAFSQDSVIEMSSATSLAPFSLATGLLESGTLTTLFPLGLTIATAQARGVAGKEQLKDDLHALNDDMASGLVNSIEEVRQPALKELFIEISHDEDQIAEINAVVTEGNEFQRIATAVTIALLFQ